MDWYVWQVEWCSRLEEWCARWCLSSSRWQRIILIVYKMMMVVKMKWYVDRWRRDVQTSPPPDGRESSQPSHPTANFSHSHPFHHSSPSLHSDRVEKSRNPVHGARTFPGTHFHPHSEFLICQSIDTWWCTPPLIPTRPLKLTLPAITPPGWFQILWPV